MSASLARQAGDFITYVQLLRTGPESVFPPPQALSRQLRALLEPLDKAEGVGADEAEQARFALVAWADEVILKKPGWSGHEEWLRDPLQMQLWQTRRAGNEFFEHLAALRPDQHAAREVYLYVLALGFEGQYAGNPADRRALIAHTWDVLRAASVTQELARQTPLADEAYHLDIELPSSGGAGVLRVLGLTALGLLGLYALVWLVLQLLVGDVPIPKGA